MFNLKAYIIITYRLTGENKLESSDHISQVLMKLDIFDMLSHNFEGLILKFHLQKHVRSTEKCHELV